MIDKDLLTNSSNPKFKVEEEKITIYDPQTLWESIQSIVMENNKNFQDNISGISTIDEHNNNFDKK